jgi:NADPH-dependent ferric siderophore reductase
MPKWMGDWLESAVGPRLKVAAVTYITPQLKRISFRGNMEKMDTLPGGASVIRVSDTDYRNYTPAFCDVPGESMEMVIHIHGGGVGSAYIDDLEPGDELYVSYPRGRKAYDLKAQQQIIFGDETSLGLACALQPLLKAQGQSFRFLFELDAVNQQAPALLGLENCSVFPKKGLFWQASRIETLLNEYGSGLEGASYILTGNVQSMQAFRKALKGRTEGEIFTQGYWLEGKKGL